MIQYLKKMAIKTLRKNDLNEICEMLKNYEA